MLIGIPLLILIIGVLVWVLAANTYLKEIGRWMFVVGLFFCVWATTGKNVRLF